MDREDFDELLRLISIGEATAEELQEAILHCVGTVLETGQLLRALIKAYGALQAAVERKDRKLRAAREFAQREKNMADEVIGHYDERKEGKHGQNKAN
jgi:hypothetical protein